jgi:D-alanyl-D-alanine carboxypeptidase
MQPSLASTIHRRRPAQVRRLAFLALGVCLAALPAALVTVAVNATFLSAVQPFAPTVDDGLIAEGVIVRLSDGDVPAVARLDPALRDAMRQAEADAAAEGLEFEVTSGWRSARYQQWLLEEAAELYADEVVARRFVATPDRSRHVTGRAVDIAPVDAQFWLIEHGARYGICQTYANESWHFELVIAPGAVCPPMKPDAAS